MTKEEKMKMTWELLEETIVKQFNEVHRNHHGGIENRILGWTKEPEAHLIRDEHKEVQKVAAKYIPEWRETSRCILCPPCPEEQWKKWWA